MKKVLFVICTMLMAATVFSESLFDYIPCITWKMVTSTGFVISPDETGTTYSISALYPVDVDILAVKGNGSSIEFFIRERRPDKRPEANFYVITVDPQTHAETVECLDKPDLNGFWLFSGTTNDSAINYRDAPTLTGTKTGQYQEGNTVHFSGGMDGWAAIDDAEDYWYSLVAAGKTVWMYGKYISFPGSVTLTADMFSKPQDFAIQIPGQTKAPLSSLPVKTAHDSREWKTGETAEIIETGVSTVCIKTNYEDRYNSHITHRLLITNGDGTIADSVLDNVFFPVSHPSWLYAPKTSRLYYESSGYYSSAGISCLDCQDGSVPSPFDNPSFHPDFQESIFGLNETENKLVYLINGWTSDSDAPHSVLQVLDLETSETRNYAVEQQRMSVSEIEWINDDEIITVEMTGTNNNRKFVINRYALEDSQVVLKDSFTEEQSFESCQLIKAAGPSQFLFFQQKITSHETLSSAELLTFTDTGIERSPVLQNSQFINKIWYQGEEYLCVIEPKAGSDTSYDAVFYNTALEETARKPFTTKAAADEVRWIGIQDDTILITTELCK